jgi:cyclic-di-AMP phosphodiesterase PgpH
MPEILNIHEPGRKNIVNVVTFIISTLIIVLLILIPDWKEGSLVRLPGYIIMISSCHLILYLFLYFFRQEILKVMRKTFFIIITILLFVVLTRVVIVFDSEMLYLLPFAIIPVIIRTFYDTPLAFFVLFITIILSAFFVPEPFYFVFISFISGAVAIFSLENIYRRTKLLLSSVVIILSYSIIYLAISLLDAGSLSDINLSEFKWFVANGALIFIFYPLIFLFERKFFFLSYTTLTELSDTNKPLLRRLAEEAPGSFQHSRQVANLAEEAARGIGANLLLARAGGLYHDIGKIVNSEYFIENQVTGSNPHQDMDPLESSKLIINHVTEGVAIARQYKLPVQIIDFIRTHHGTTKAYFFYRKYLENNKKGEGDDKVFAYPGPKPFSREMAIVMMADAVEASSRTLDSYTEETINDLVEKIFLQQEQDDQLSDAPLTFKDISEVKSVFKKRLSNIYHARLAYPEKDGGDD